jgi:hypothetical protein
MESHKLAYDEHTVTMFVGEVQITIQSNGFLVLILPPQKLNPPKRNMIELPPEVTYALMQFFSNTYVQRLLQKSDAQDR